MSLKTTYLFGAGASHPTLPMLKDFPKKVEEVYYEIEKIRGSKSQKPYDIKPSQKDLDTLFSDFKTLWETSKVYQTIDVYSKFLYDSDDRIKLSKLKFTLSLFFTFLQSTQVVNPKYVTLLANIVERDSQNKLHFPSNVKILTWNYDAQIELAAKNYFRLPNFSEVEEKVSFYPRSFIGNSARPDFDVIHLNGIAGLFDTPRTDVQKTNHLLRALDSDYLNVINEIGFSVESFRQESIYVDDIFTYCWEKKSYDKQILEAALKIASETEVLVINGYSFPNFNRDYDVKLFEEFRKNTQMIYVQNPDFDVNSFKKKFQLTNMPIQQIQNLDTFHLPDELYVG